MQALFHCFHRIQRRTPRAPRAVGGVHHTELWVPPMGYHHPPGGRLAGSGPRATRAPIPLPPAGRSRPSLGPGSWVLSERQHFASLSHAGKLFSNR